MLGKHIWAGEVPGMEWTQSVEVPMMGSLGAVHADTIGFTWIVMGGILLASLMIRPALVADGPGGTLQAVAEGYYKFISDLAESQIGHKFKQFLPLVAAIFIFVLIANLAGIGPWNGLHHLPGWPHVHAEMGKEPEFFEIASPTTDFNVTFGLALIALITYLWAGFKAHGGGFIKMYVWHPMAPIEWMDMLLRPMTLGLRLLLVITADELTRMVFLFMLPWIAPTFVMAFEIFIAIIQAFVFALLTSIYIGLAVADHH